ncbi:MAG: circularly permuted type 2 ATP-grasp protein, partial [Planctomycetales bacterium]|nr:circularly permuted type 2 ATP-grasp protein [Planctomycetales bacterium]
MIAGYPLLPDVFDEMVDAQGQVREHWAQLAAHLQSLGAEELQHRWEQAQRQIRSLGMTFNPQDETGEGSRPWELDAIPLVLTTEQWSTLDGAVAQRARLFERILDDIYGEQRLLIEKLVPPELVFMHPGFQTAYHGLPTAQNRRLVLFASDVARGPDGNWWVTSDRTRAPTGLGYLLENRIVTSRMLPAAFRQSHVLRLAGFFMTLRDTLHDLAARSRDNPRTVLWSQGTSSPSYFEDAYLARYLNVTLVESGDLAVRGNRLMLKTLGGLLPIEVAMRRVDDELCDPVELAADSTSGASGLVEVVRDGNVALANSLGSRIVESPAWLPFLPAICRRLLDEDLQIPSVATWWCGHDDARKYVLEHLDTLAIRPAFRMGTTPTLRADQMSKSERERLIATIERDPRNYVGQELVVRSTSPVWDGAKMTPWFTALRCFAVACDKRSFQVLPGGLARASSEPSELHNMRNVGQRSQDVWVVSQTPVEHVTLLGGQGKSLSLRRSGAELPSRVADNLFWLGRHVERADGTARLLRTLLARLTSDEDDDAVELPALLRMAVELGQIEPDYAVEELRRSLPPIETVLAETVFSEDAPRSLYSTIRHTLRYASTVRDRLSVDAFKIIHEAAAAGGAPMGRQSSADATDVLEKLQ